MTFRYATRNATGGVCCAGNDLDFPRCPKCKGASMTPRTPSNHDTVPDPYAPSLAAMRAASATAESTFAEQYAAERTAAFNAEYAAASKREPQPPMPRLTAAELAPYAPPDPYREGIRKLQEQEQAR